jgi:hypothetical protein
MDFDVVPCFTLYLNHCPYPAIQVPRLQILDEGSYVDIAAFVWCTPYMGPEEVDSQHIAISPQDTNCVTCPRDYFS